MDTSEGHTVVTNGRDTKGKREEEEGKRGEEGGSEAKTDHAGGVKKSTVTAEPDENVVLCPCGCNEVSVFVFMATSIRIYTCDFFE